ncbi:N-acetylglucosamine kinase [Propionibacteriaceae bacterium G1746]
MTTPAEHITASTTPQRIVIGVDAGGTSTKAVLLDETGCVLATSRTGPGNPTSAGHDLAVANIVAACTAVVHAARARHGQVPPPSFIAFTMAGVLAAGGRLPGVDEALAQAGIPAPISFHGDVLSAYFSATAADEGAVLIAGTGCTSARVSGGAIADTHDGLGWLIGDEGSGFWIGRKVVQAVCRALDRRGPDTALVDELVAMVDVDSELGMPWKDQRLLNLIAWSYGRRPVELAAAGELVARVPDDPVARGIITEAADRLLVNLNASVTTPKAGPLDGPVVLGGSVVSPGSPVGDLVMVRLTEQLGADKVLRARDGRAGAGLLALRGLGVRSDSGVLAVITEGLVGS